MNKYNTTEMCHRYREKRWNGVKGWLKQVKRYKIPLTE